MKQIYYSIRVVEATSENSAINKIHAGKFNEQDELCDKVLTKSELLHALNGTKPKSNWIVEVSKDKKTTQINGMLATCHVKDLTLICIYSRGEAIKKARMFDGKAKLYTEKLNPKKHYNQNF